MNKPPPTLLENKKIKMNRNIEVLGVFRIHLFLSHFITSELLAIFFIVLVKILLVWACPPHPLFYMMLHAFFIYKKTYSIPF